MTQVVTVLKKAVVREAPRVHLGAASSGPALPPGGAMPGAGPQPQVRIVEQNESAALVEVLCPCGCRIVLKCQTGFLAPVGEGTLSKEHKP